MANVAIMGILTNQASLSEKEIQLIKQGEEAERHIAKLLKPLCGRGGQLVSKLDDNRLRLPELGDLDILLNLSGIRFAISVKSKRGDKIKVFYDRDHQAIRFSTKKGKDQFIRDIVQELNEQVDWLLDNRPKFFSKKKKQPKMPWKIVVVCSAPSYPVEHPVKVAVFPDSPKEVIGGLEFLKHEGVYVVEEEKLLSLLQALRKKSQ